MNAYTDQFNRNRIVELKSFYVIANLINLISEQEKKYYLYFNFYQYVKLYEISKYENKMFFLLNFVEFNNESNSLSFNYKAFDEFDIRTLLENKKKYSLSKIKRENANDDLFIAFEFFAKKINIEFRKMQWSITTIEKRNEITKTWEIGKELEEELIDSILYSSSDSWTKLLNECLKKLNEPVPVLPKSGTKKKMKKKKIGIRSNSSTRRSSKTKIKKIFPIIK